MTVTLTEFTDPFCTWCWGAEPVLRRVEETYHDQVDIDFVMGGLVADFSSFCDAANDITEPADVAPHWEKAASRHGMPVDSSIWRTDPPQSSYPACIAYHAAASQDTDLAHRYLRRMRAALATEQRNIGEREVLIDLADEVGLDVERFRAALEGERAQASFEEDRLYARRKGATTFPTFRVEGDDDRWLSGTPSFPALADALEAVAPGLERRSPRPLPAFVEAYGPVATQEVAEVYDLARDEAFERLVAIANDGDIAKIERGTGHFWESVSTDRADPRSSNQT